MKWMIHYNYHQKQLFALLGIWLLMAIPQAQAQLTGSLHLRESSLQNLHFSPPEGEKENPLRLQLQSDVNQNGKKVKLCIGYEFRPASLGDWFEITAGISQPEKFKSCQTYVGKRSPLIIDVRYTGPDTNLSGILTLMDKSYPDADLRLDVPVLIGDPAAIVEQILSFPEYPAYQAGTELALAFDSLYLEPGTSRPKALRLKNNLDQPLRIWLKPESEESLFSVDDSLSIPPGEERTLIIRLQAPKESLPGPTPVSSRIQLISPDYSQINMVLNPAVVLLHETKVSEIDAAADVSDKGLPGWLIFAILGMAAAIGWYLWRMRRQNQASKELSDAEQKENRTQASTAINLDAKKFLPQLNELGLIQTESTAEIEAAILKLLNDQLAEKKQNQNTKNAAKAPKPKAARTGFMVKPAEIAGVKGPITTLLSKLRHYEETVQKIVSRAKGNDRKILQQMWKHYQAKTEAMSVRRVNVEKVLNGKEIEDSYMAHYLNGELPRDQALLKYLEDFLFELFSDLLILLEEVSHFSKFNQESKIAGTIEEKLASEPAKLRKEIEQLLGLQINYVQLFQSLKESDMKRLVGREPEAQNDWYRDLTLDKNCVREIKQFGYSRNGEELKETIIIIS